MFLGEAKIHTQIREIGVVYRLKLEKRSFHMGNCNLCGGSYLPHDGGSSSWMRPSQPQPLSEEELSARRAAAAAAAEERSKKFSQGGGGEKLKAKAKALEEAEKKNRDLGGGPTMKWTV